MAKAKQDYEKRDYHQELTDKVLARMQEAKDQKWTKPWFPGPSRRPMNAMTGKAYSGCNQLTLSLSGYEDHRWFTFNGIKQYGAKHDLDLSIKGEKGTTVFKAFIKEQTEDEKGQPLDEPKKIIFMIPAGTVFNAQQIKGMPPLEKEQDRFFNPIQAGEELKHALIDRTGLKIETSAQGAWYRPSTHTVGMPRAESFISEAAYYDTLFHEFGHSTGPALNRQMKGAFGTMDYAYEELIAELNSCFMSAELGIEHNQFSHDQNAAYLNNWIQVLNNDKNFIFKASNAASRACNHQMEHLREYLYEFSMAHTASEAQNNLLEAIGVPLRIQQQIHGNQDQEAESQDTPVLAPAPKIYVPEPAPTQIQRPRQGMSMSM